MRRRKKSESLDVRLSYEDKKAFTEMCAARGLSVSEAIRGYIAKDLKRHRRILQTQFGAMSMSLISTSLLVVTTAGLHMQSWYGAHMVELTSQASAETSHLFDEASLFVQEQEAGAEEETQPVLIEILEDKEDNLERNHERESGLTPIFIVQVPETATERDQAVEAYASQISNLESQIGALEAQDTLSQSEQDQLAALREELRRKEFALRTIRSHEF